MIWKHCQLLRIGLQSILEKERAREKELKVTYESFTKRGKS